MIRPVHLLLGAVLAVAPLGAAAQTPPPPPPPEAKTSATPYVQAAGQSDLYEINSSQVVLEKSQNAGVRKFAQMMIQHHQKTTAATVKAAGKVGLNPPPPALAPGAQTSIAELQNASAADVDRLYLAQQIPAHEAALDLHQSYAKGGDQAALRTSAKSAVPIVRQHLDAATKLRSGL